MATRPSRGDPVWAIVLGTALLLLVLGGGVTALVYFARQSFISKTSPEAVDAAFAADPNAAPILQAIREDYPEEHAKIREALSRSARRGSPPVVLKQQTYSLLREAALAHLDELAQAPHDKLMALNAAETRMLEKLEAADVVLCGRYFMRGFTPEDFVEPGVRPLLSDLNVAQWRASAAGRDWPVDREPPATLSQRDTAALVRAMRKQGMSDADLRVFVSPPLLARAEPWRQCALAKWLVAAVTAVFAAASAAA